MIDKKKWGTKFVIFIIVGLFLIISCFIGFLNTFFAAVLISIPLLFSLMCYLSVKRFISKRRIAKPEIEKKEVKVKLKEIKAKEIETALQRIEQYRKTRKHRIAFTLLAIFLLFLVIFLLRTQIEKPSCGDGICESISYKENYKTCPTDCNVNFYGREIYGEYVTYDCPADLVPTCEKYQKGDNDMLYPLLKEFMGDFDSIYCNNRFITKFGPAHSSIIPIIVHIIEEDSFFSEYGEVTAADGFTRYNEIFIKREAIRQVSEDFKPTYGGGLVSHEMIHVFDFCFNPAINIEITEGVIKERICDRLTHEECLKEPYEGIDEEGLTFIETPLSYTWKTEIRGSPDKTKEFFKMYWTSYTDDWFTSKKELVVTYQFVDLAFFDDKFVKEYYSLLGQYPNNRNWEDIANFVYIASGRREDIKEFFEEHGFSESDFT